MSKDNDDLKNVREIALALPDVKESTTKLGTGWKVRGRLMTCQAIHKSAEPNSLMVRVSTGERERLLKEQPNTFYLTDHYRPYDAILVRLSKVNQTTLRDVLNSAWRFVREGS